MSWKEKQEEEEEEEVVFTRDNRGGSDKSRKDGKRKVSWLELSGPSRRLLPFPPKLRKELGTR